MIDSEHPTAEDRTGVLVHGQIEDLPPNAVLLTATDIYRIRKKQIASWKNRSEVWPFAYGPQLATATVGISAFITNINARQLFNLRAQKFFWSTALPTLVFPIVSFWTAYELLVTRAILTRPPVVLNGDGPCDVCLEVRASAIQLFCGTIFPFGLSFLTSSLAAITDRTYPVPPLNKPGSVLKTLKLYSRSFRISGPVLMLIHTFMGSGLAAMMLRVNEFSLNREEQLQGNAVVHPALKTS